MCTIKCSDVIYKENHQNSDLQKYAFFGLVLIVLSIGMSLYIVNLALNGSAESPRTLGVSLAQTTGGKDSGITDPGDESYPSEGDGSTYIIPDEQRPIYNVSPTSAPITQSPVEPVITTALPTATPTKLPTPTPTRVPSPTQTVVIATPTPEPTIIQIPPDEDEVVIENDNSTLIVIGGNSGTEIVQIPSDPVNPAPTKTPTPTPYQGDVSSPGTIATPVPTTSTGTKYTPPTPTPTPIAQDSDSGLINNVLDTLLGRDSVSPETESTPGDPNNTVVITDSSESVAKNTNVYNDTKKVNRSLVSRIRQTLTGKTEYEEPGNTDRGLIESVRTRIFGRNSHNDEVTPPITSLRIAITSEQQTNPTVNELLARYQFQVWAVGDSMIAIHRNGITALSPFPIKIGVRQLSFKVRVQDRDIKMLHYQDTAYEKLKDLRIISEDQKTPIMIQYRSGDLHYDIQGRSRQFLLGALPVSICSDSVVSGLSGNLISTQPCSSFDAMLDSISLSLF